MRLREDGRPERVSVVHPMSLSALRYLAAMAVGGFFLWASVSSLMVSLPGGINADLAAKATPKDFSIPDLEPIAAGTISALTPLPQSATASEPEVAATPPAAVAAPAAVAVTGPSLRVTSGGLNVRSDADKYSPLVGALVRGDIVYVIEERGSWRLVETGNGIRGWVSAKYLAE
jgi:hypothetical protein